MFYKKGYSEKFRNIHRKTSVLESLFNKIAGLQVFSCEYCDISKNGFFIEHLQWLLLNLVFRISYLFRMREYEKQLHLFQSKKERYYVGKPSLMVWLKLSYEVIISNILVKNQSDHLR